jgi:hypothetical protein
VQSLFSLERPQLAFDRTGRPVSLLCAADYNEKRETSFNIGIPLGAVDDLLCEPAQAVDSKP